MESAVDHDLKCVASSTCIGHGLFRRRDSTVDFANEQFRLNSDLTHRSPHFPIRRLFRDAQNSRAHCG